MSGKDKEKEKGNRPTTSIWWKHFTRSAKPDMALCSLCKKDVKKGGGTTNLRTHLQRNHYPEFFALNQSERARREEDESVDDVDEVGSPMSPPSSSPSPTPPLSPSPSSSMFRSPSPSPLKSQKRTHQTSISEFRAPDTKSMERLHMHVAYFIGTTNLPLSTVEKEGFTRLCNALRPGYKPPGRKALTNNYIPKLYLSTKENIERMLAGAKWIALSSDAWTSVADDSYLALSAHFINGEWKLLAVTLNCRIFLADHTGLNYRDWFKDTLREWNIEMDKVVSVSIDNGDNIRLAVDLLSKPSVRCIGHTLQTGITDIDVLPRVAQLKKASHKMLSFFSGTKVWNRYEAFVQKTYDVSPKSLPHPVKTRWWSELPLLRVLKEEEAYHRGFLADYDSGKHLALRLSPEEMETLNIYLSTLEPIEELSTVLSADQYVTASAILPVLYALEKMLERLNSLGADNLEFGEADDASDGASALKAADMLKLIVRKLHKRYSPSGVERDATEPDRPTETVRNCDVRGRETLYQLLIRCSNVDCRFRDDLTEEDRECARDLLLEAIEESLEQEKARDRGASSNGRKTKTPASQSESPPPPKRAKGMASVFSKLAGSSGQEAENEELSLKQRLKIEIQKYESVSLAKDEDILDWWRLHEKSFPLLATLARKYLAIPATSTESERIFSWAGIIINKLRSCLTGTNAERQIFLGMNKRFVPNI